MLTGPARMLPLPPPLHVCIQVAEQEVAGCHNSSSSDLVSQETLQAQATQDVRHGPSTFPQVPR